MKKYIEPKILQGTRDFLPEDMAKRDFMLGKIKSVFSSFGYDSIQTPAIEYAETILGKYGEEATKLVYRFKDNGDRDIALRYDQTVPFARVVAANYKTLPMPFKRYQVGPVWRGDRPGKGRYREFYQCDIDIIGTKNLMAEAEIAAAIQSVFKTLGFKNFVIKFNSRRLLNSILADLKIKGDDQASTMRILDKLDKVGVKGVTEELSPYIGVEKSKELLNVITTAGNSKEKISALKKYDTAEIEEFVKLTELYGIKEENLFFDPSLARGLDYYTGIIFEVFSPEVAIGAVCAGGRYDDLCAMFSPEQFSGVGVAFGFDRILVAMEDLGLLKEVSLNSQVLVTYFNNETLPESVRLLGDLRKSGMNAEMYFEPAKLAKQMKYADKKQIPFVLVYGETEKKDGTITIKRMSDGEQKNIPLPQAVSYIRNYYAHK